jgi:hypothetical protein
VLWEDRVTLPEFTTPEELAKHLGWSEKRVRSLARRIGACRVLGNRMALLNEDVTRIKAAIGTEALKKAQMRLHLERPSFVYFVAVRDFIKIGWSENWRSRLANMQTSNPDPIKVLLILARPKSFESEMHELFAAHATRGEWFKDNPDIRAYIKGHKDECWYRARRSR